MIARVLLISSLLLSLPTGTALARMAPEVVAAAETYARELSEVEREPKRQSLERVFALATDLVEALRRPDPSATQPPDSLAQAEFASFGERLRGIVLEQGSAIIDPAFFEKLGERKGRTEDRLFLRLYHRAYPTGDRPAYMQSRSQESGCVDFGDGTLVSLFSEWSRYGARHSKQYVPFVQSEMKRIREAMTQATCACGSSGSVQSELRFFLRRFPDDPASEVVRKRFEEVRRGTSNIRFNCRPS
jgi:hypothetical protein